MAAALQSTQVAASKESATILPIEVLKKDIRFPGQRNSKIIYCAPRKPVLLARSCRSAL